MMPPMMPPPPQGAFASLQERSMGASPLGEMLSLGGAQAAPIENPVESSPAWFEDPAYGGAGMAPSSMDPSGALPPEDPAAINGDFDRRQALKDDMIMLLQQRAKARGQATDKFQRYAAASAKSGQSGPIV